MFLQESPACRHLLCILQHTESRLRAFATLPCLLHLPLRLTDSMTMVKRHQMIYKLVDDEIKAGVHALSMTTKTPKEVAASD